MFVFLLLLAPRQHRRRHCRHDVSGEISYSEFLSVGLHATPGASRTVVAVAAVVVVTVWPFALALFMPLSCWHCVVFVVVVIHVFTVGLIHLCRAVAVASCGPDACSQLARSLTKKTSLALAVLADCVGDALRRPPRTTHGNAD